MRRSDMSELELLMDVDPAEAVALARRISAEIPGDADVWGWLADACVANGQFDDALAALAEYLRRDPDWVEAYAQRASLLAELGRFDAAVIELEVGRSLDSESPRLVQSEAMCLELQGKLKEADALYDRAEQLDSAVEAPPRFDRGKARQAIQGVLRQVAKSGLKLNAVIEEVPKRATSKKLLSRQLELQDERTLVVYLRNLERELTGDAEIEDLAELFEDRLAELVDAN
ncbi:MAG: tetratricopeptide repeat protein [Deltaproteobacteria bacterium]|nr:tetratricopeptide repeat protein [Deltaproteobacteria bacterium]